jgi:hypothetical protein
MNRRELLQSASLAAFLDLPLPSQDGQETIQSYIPAGVPLYPQINPFRQVICPGVFLDRPHGGVLNLKGVFTTRPAAQVSRAHVEKALG